MKESMTTDVLFAIWVELFIILASLIIHIARHWNDYD